MPIGRPKYVNGKDPVAQSKVLARWSNFSFLTLIGTIIDLENLIFRPVELLKDWRIPFRKNSYVAEASRMIRVSSSYCMIGKSLVGARTGNLKWPSWAALLMMIEEDQLLTQTIVGRQGLLVWPLFFNGRFYQEHHSAVLQKFQN